MSDCLGRHDSACHGKTVERYSLSGSGMTFPRCDKHYGEYVARTQPMIDDVRRRYPDRAPADFDPLYAGERWDEDE
jgi:hypothetical protein